MRAALSSSCVAFCVWKTKSGKWKVRSPRRRESVLWRTEIQSEAGFRFSQAASRSLCRWLFLARVSAARHEATAQPRVLETQAGGQHGAGSSRHPDTPQERLAGVADLGTRACTEKRSAAGGAAAAGARMNQTRTCSWTEFSSLRSWGLRDAPICRGTPFRGRRRSVPIPPEAPPLATKQSFPMQGALPNPQFGSEEKVHSRLRAASFQTDGSSTRDIFFPQLRRRG